MRKPQNGTIIFLRFCSVPKFNNYSCGRMIDILVLMTFSRKHLTVQIQIRLVGLSFRYSQVKEELRTQIVGISGAFFSSLSHKRESHFCFNGGGYYYITTTKGVVVQNWKQLSNSLYRLQKSQPSIAYFSALNSFKAMMDDDGSMVFLESCQTYQIFNLLLCCRNRYRNGGRDLFITL